MAKSAGSVRGHLRTGAVLLVAVLAAVGATTMVRPWIAPQARAFVVLASTVNAPGLTWLATQVTHEPRSAEARVGGVAATITQPRATGRFPVIVLLNGATASGRYDKGIRALADGLARAGYLVVVPELPGLRHAEVTRATLRTAVAVAGASARRADARDGKIALFGMSTGGSLALLAAEDPSLAGRVRVVAAMGAFTDIRAAVRLATTHTYEKDGHIAGYRAKSYLALALGRSLVAALSPGSDRRHLLEALDGVDRDAVDPLAAVRAIPPSHLRSPARAVVAVLSNREPRRFDALYAALPPAVRDTCRRLSPVSGATRLKAPVLLAADPRDAFFPPTHAAELEAAAHAGVVSTIRTVSHGPPRRFVRGLGDALRLDVFLVKALRLASA